MIGIWMGVIKSSGGSGPSSAALYGIGNNAEGAFGGPGASGMTPRATTMSGSLLGKTISQISCGQTHTLVLCSDGTVHGWGLNNYSCIDSSVGDFSTVSAPILKVNMGSAAGKTVIKVSAADACSAILCSDGTVHCWGNGGEGKLGNGSTANQANPVQVSVAGVLSGKTVTDICAAGTAFLVITSDSILCSWGGNGIGALGDGSTTNRSSPVAVLTTGSLIGKTALKIFSHTYGFFVIATDNSMHGWGWNLAGQLGIGTTTGWPPYTTSISVFTTIPGGVYAVSIVGFGAGTVAILGSDNVVYAVGEGSGYERGVNSATDSNVIAAVTTTNMSGETPTAVSGFNTIGLILTASGKLFAMGNYGGTNYTIPTQVTPPSGKVFSMLSTATAYNSTDSTILGTT